MKDSDGAERPARPARRTLWSSGWLGTPALIGGTSAVLGVFNAFEHSWTAMTVNAVVLVGMIVTAGAARRQRARPRPWRTSRL